MRSVWRDDGGRSSHTRRGATAGRTLRPAEVGVLIVDDSAPFRRAARDVVAATPGFEVVGEAASGEEALSALEELDPCLVLLDVTMGGIDGIETARRITAGYPRPTVVLVSVTIPPACPQGWRPAVRWRSSTSVTSGRAARGSLGDSPAGRLRPPASVVRAVRALWCLPP